MSLVEVKNVSFTYPNGFVAVDGVSFKLEKGENIAIVGQNGAGKTTTVKMLNGLTKPTSGDIIVDGKNTKEYTTAQIARTVGYVFQNPDDQIFNNTVYKEIEYGLKRMKLPKEERERRIMDAAVLTGRLHVCGHVGHLTAPHQYAQLRAAVGVVHRRGRRLRRHVADGRLRRLRRLQLPVDIHAQNGHRRQRQQDKEDPRGAAGAAGFLFC